MPSRLLFGHAIVAPNRKRMGQTIPRAVSAIRRVTFIISSSEFGPAPRPQATSGGSIDTMTSTHSLARRPTAFDINRSSIRGSTRCCPGTGKPSLPDCGVSGFRQSRSNRPGAPHEIRYGGQGACELSPYVPGRTAYANLAKLNTNESPFGPSPRGWKRCVRRGCYAALLS